MTTTINAKKLAHLARLGMEEERLDTLNSELEQIKALVEHISAVDTDHIEPMAHPYDQTQRLRADEISESDNRQALQALAPCTEAGLYLVPKVIERDL